MFLINKIAQKDFFEKFHFVFYSNIIILGYGRKQIFIDN